MSYFAKSNDSEKGSALLITIMVMVILTMLGLSFMLFSSTEQQISVNYRDATQVIYVAEGVANIAERWFNDPNVYDSSTGTGNPLFPIGIGMSTDTITHNGATFPVELINMNDDGTPLRWIDFDWDGDLDPPADHNMGAYLGNGSGAFRKPYMGAAENTFWGSEENPDLILSQGYLDKINTAYLAGYTGDPGDMQIVDIRIYRPPLDLTTSARLGIATIKVTAAKILNGKNGPYRAAQRHVKIVLGEFSLMDEVVAVSADSGIAQTGSQGVHWGCEQTEEDLDQGTGVGAFAYKIRTGMFYKKVTASYQPPRWDLTSMEWLLGTQLNGNLDIDDPWFLIRTGGNIVQEDQSVGANTLACASGDYETDYTCYSSVYIPIEGNSNFTVGQIAADIGTGNSNGIGFTNMFQFVDVEMPEFDYETWKNIVLAGLQSSESDKFHFFDWNGSAYVERGSGITGDVNSFFEQSGDYFGVGGVYFFDTTDSQEPADLDGDGDIDANDNLTSSFTIMQSLYRGIIYINSDDVKFTADAKATIPVTAPGESYSDGLPFIFYPDASASWMYNNADPNGATHATVNLASFFYPDNLAGSAVRADVDDHRDIIWDCVTNLTDDPDRKLNTFRKPNNKWDFIDWSESLSAGAVVAMDDENAPGDILDVSELVFKGINDAADFDPTVDPHEPYANFVYPSSWILGNTVYPVTLDYRPVGGEYPVPDRGIGEGDTHNMDIIVDGVMFIAGAAEGTGNPNVYGSVTTRDAASLHGNVEIWFNQKLVNGLALDDYGLPSVVRFQKQTDM